MLEFVIFAVAVIVCLIVAVIYLYPGSKSVTTVPGLQPVDTLEGNFPDIASAGSLHEFLMDIHSTYGSIASFWWGPKLAVSIASPALFKEHAKVFDRPADLFELFRPFFGDHSIQYANGAESRLRHKCYSRCYTAEAVAGYYDTLHKLAAEFVNKLKTLSPEEHIPLREYMFDFAIKSMLLTSFGSFFTSAKDVTEIRRAYDYCWYFMEEQLGNSNISADSARQAGFDKHLKKIKDILRHSMQYRKNNRPEGECLIIDVIMEKDTSESAKLDDMVTFLVASFHTTGLLLTWAVYFLCTHPEVQDKVFREIQEVLEGETVESASAEKLTYLRQVVDETLRCSVLGPYAARYQDKDVELGGHRIPAGTPVIQALGVVHQDPTVYPDPEKFDPERFSKENREHAPPLSFEPFGFAGKRKCLGYRFSLAEAYVLLTQLLTHFEVTMVPGQVVRPVHGLVTSPKEEIWVTVSPRK